MQRTYEVDTRYCTDKSYLRGFETVKKIIFLLSRKNCRFDRRCIIVSSINLCKKVHFENFVTYEGLHGHRRDAALFYPICSNIDRMMPTSVCRNTDRSKFRPVCRNTDRIYFFLILWSVEIKIRFISPCL